jgi:hypothetical protein
MVRFAVANGCVIGIYRFPLRQEGADPLAAAVAVDVQPESMPNVVD